MASYCIATANLVEGAWILAIQRRAQGGRRRRRAEAQVLAERFAGGLKLRVRRATEQGVWSCNGGLIMKRAVKLGLEGVVSKT
jgi:hypothetical protein